jgi:hypothetical protein
MELIVITLIVILVLLGCALYLKKAWKKNRLRGAARTRALEHMKRVRTLSDYHRRILDADSVLEHALGDLGYSGSMADKLRSAGKFLPGLQDIWTAHKLRNRIAHEPGIMITEKESDHAVTAFDRAVVRLCS